MTNKLYKSTTPDGNGNDRFFTYLATDSQGNFVMEEINTKRVIAISPTAVEEVLPYTIDVIFSTSKSSSQNYSYFAKEGQVKVGDRILADNGSLCYVEAVDTKSKAATKWLRGFVFEGRYISIPNGVDK